MHMSKVMLCIKKRDERKDGRTHQKQYAEVPTVYVLSKKYEKYQRFVSEIFQFLE